MSGINGGNLGSPRVSRVPVVTRLNQSFIKKADSNLKNELHSLTVGTGDHLGKLFHWLGWDVDEGPQQSGGIGLGKEFLSLRVHQKHQQNLLKHGYVGPSPEFLIQ